MTGIVIPSGREESFPGIFTIRGERKFMSHFVVKFVSGNYPAVSNDSVA